MLRSVTGPSELQSISARGLVLLAGALSLGLLGRLLVDGLLFLEQLARLVAANLGG